HLSVARAVSSPRLPSFPTRRSSDLIRGIGDGATRGERREARALAPAHQPVDGIVMDERALASAAGGEALREHAQHLVELLAWQIDRKSTRLNSSHVKISYAVFCLKK